VDLKAELKEVIIRELKIEDVDPAQVTDDAPLFGEGLGLDSLDAVELVLILKKHYGIEIKDMTQAREAFASINALHDHILAHQKTS
jgi:acyl carrier protein